MDRQTTKIVNHIRELFPDLTETIIKQELSKNEYDVDDSIKSLLKYNQNEDKSVEKKIE